MAYKNKEKELDYYRKYYLEKKKPKYVPHPRIKQTEEERLAKKREWYNNNIIKCRLQAKKSREKHKEKRKLENKKWVENNKEYYKKYQKQYKEKWYQENKQAHLQKGKEWVKNNPEKVKEIQNKYEKQPKAKLRTTKHGAKKRNYEYALSDELFYKIISLPCMYCGSMENIGIDRKDNSIGYTSENSAPCCTTCNMMKKVLSVNDFLSHVQKIHNHQQTIIN